MPKQLTPLLLTVLVLACGTPAPVASPPRAAPPSQTNEPATTTPAPADPTPPSFRLPGDVRPSRAKLDLTLVPDQPHLDGVARFELDVVRPTAVVWLHGKGLSQLRATIDGAPARVLLGDTDFIGVLPTAPLATGASTLEIHFRAPIDRERSRGVYAEAEGEHWYAYTMFEPIDARRAFPCFDEPGIKIPWQLTFHVRREHVALANAPVTSEHDEANGMKRVEIAESKPLPSYLVAFVVGPFDLVDGGLAGRARTQIRFVVPRGRGGETRYAREATPRVVELLEDYFDMPYPYEKLDVAVVPRYWGTMEHPGIVAMGQPLTLIPPDQETSSRKQAYANILIHELAHYWFGDVVTMAWWNDTWLNEALATWLDIKLTHQFEPAWRYADDGLSTANDAMNTDQLLAARAMRQPVNSSEEIQASFDNYTTYYKGAAVLRMFETWIGPEQFQSFIRSYIRTHMWGTATADDFLAALTTATGPQVTTAFRTFLEQPGVPAVDMALRCTKGRPMLHLSQRRSLPEHVSPPAASTWHIPVCVRYGSRREQRRHCELLTTQDAVLPLPGPCPTVLIPNANGDGYYRSRVTEPTASLTDAWLPRRERLTALNDAVTAWQHGQLPIDALLAMGLRMQGDRDAHVARRAVRLLWATKPNHLDDEDRRHYDRLALKTFGARARKLGWLRRDADDDELHDLRKLLVSEIAEHDPTLRKDAARLAHAFLRDPSSVPDDIVDHVLRVTAESGDRALFDQLVAAAKHATDHRLRRRLLRATGAFRDPALATAARELILAPELDRRESLGVLYVQLWFRPTRDDAWRWARANLSTLLAGMRDDEAAWLLASLGDTHCDRARRDEAAAWLTPIAAQIDGAQNALAQALERADRCIETTERDLPAIRGFLSRH